MARKRSNLAVAADVGSVAEVLQLADAVGPHIAVLKTHVDIFDAWSADLAAQLRALADKHGAPSGLFFPSDTPLSSSVDYACMLTPDAPDATHAMHASLHACLG
jgi:hypothetical protein